MGLNRTNQLPNRSVDDPCPVCNEKEGDDEHMIGCPGCQMWFHQVCVGIENIGDVVPEWKCVSCTGAASQSQSALNPMKVKGSTNAQGKVPRQSTARSHKSDASSTERRKLLLDSLNNSRALQDILKQEREEKLREKVLLDELINLDDARSSQIDALDDILEPEREPRATKPTAPPLSHRASNQSEFHRRDGAAGCRNQLGSRGAQSLLSGVPQGRANDCSIRRQNATVSHFAPTQQQLAARHTLGKDLPKFNGKPRDWPIFMSSFTESTMACGYTHNENLVRLQKCLQDPAKKMVESCLRKAEYVPVILETLQKLYGRPELIINDLVAQIKAHPPPKAEKLETVVSFSVQVHNLCVTLEDPDLEDHRRNPTLVHELVTRLPSSLKLRWSETNVDRNDVVVFGRWLYDIGMNLCTTLPESSLPFEDVSKVRSDDKSKDRKKELVGVHKDQNSPDGCTICRGTCKNVTKCPTFKDASPSKRNSFVHELKLCYRCLNKHSFQNPCENPIKCNSDSCTKKHHPMLHKPEKDTATTADTKSTDSKPAVANASSFTHTESNGETRYRYIPVTIMQGEKRVQTFAFLDEGSSITLMTKRLAKSLGLTGRQCPLNLSWTDDTMSREDPSSEIIQFTVAAGKKTHSLSARTISSLALPTQTLDYEMLSQKFSHLKKLPVKSYSGVKPELLIGLDNWNLGIPLKIKEGKIKEPIGIKCRLGWTVFAVGHSKDFQNLFHCCNCPNPADDEEIISLIKSFYSTESLGVRPNPEAIESQKEKRARDLMKSTLKRNGDRFEIGLLWKSDTVSFPNSRLMAEKRLKCLEACLRKSPEKLEALNKLMSDYLEKGYIYKITPNDSFKSTRSWYLPIFLVRNPNKPGKDRPVWDAASEVDGVSLNSVLLSGPDLTSSLLGVLLRFRMNEIVTVGDIKEMFHRVLVRKEDQVAQKFLWRNGNTSEPPSEYVMRVMTFGATCSPCCAQFVKNSNAEEFKNLYPKAHNSIVNNHYVDDWLESFVSVDEAIDVAKQVKLVHSRGGFEIRNWRSNSNEVLKAMGEVTQTSLDLNLDVTQQAEKVLGMWWNCHDDTFTYSLRFNKGNQAVLKGERVPTKRELLRITMSIYDPLGLLSHLIVHLKILNQETWRSKTGWDEPITDEHYKEFTFILKLLPKIEDLRIPRWYVNFELASSSIEMHTFVDASERAKAAALYLRFELNGMVKCTLVAAKTQVAPLKLLSIPDLELESAVLGARLAESVKSSLNLKISKEVMWSDSKTTLARIQSSDLRKIKKFVAYRVAEVQEKTCPSNWRYVPSSENVADDATKRTKPPNLNPNDRWFIGPSFLYETPEKWPSPSKDKIPLEADELPEVEFLCVHNIGDPIIDTSKFSSFRKLRKTVEILFSWRNFHKKEVNTSTIFNKADNWLYRHAQQRHFAKEIQALESKDKGKIQSALKGSPLYQLSPYLDENRVLRMNGRIDAALHIPDAAKRPIILPKNDDVTRLLVQSYHEKMLHAHHDIVLNELRQKYHIIGVRAVINSIKHNCLVCKIRNPKIEQPLMASLPQARLATYLPPFSHVGIDYFGPINVTVKRSTEKRYGVMFTCMTTRAVHIEVAHSMNTDSCIMCIRTFMNIRGQPLEIWSDQGKNFIASEKLLRKSVQALDTAKMAKEWEHEDIVWHFNPPASPHMGGVWERQIRTFKKSLYASLPSRNITDPILRTCMAEAAFLMNSRPLTYLPLDSDESEALTPNHFLIGSSNGIKTVGKVPDDDKYTPCGFLTAQQFKNRLWKRFVAEYLPDLVKRTKNYEACEPLQVDDIVIVCDNTLPANTWPKGRILEIFPGKDGQVRSATVKTITGTYHRPAVKLAKLVVKAKE